MSWAHALSVVQDALIFADRYVDERGTVADINRIIEEYVADKGLADDVRTVVKTAADLLNAAAGEDTAGGV